MLMQCLLDRLSVYVQYPACDQHLREEKLAGTKFVASPEFATVVSYFSKQLKTSRKQRLPIIRMTLSHIHTHLKKKRHCNGLVVYIYQL